MTNNKLSITTRIIELVDRICERLTPQSLLLDDYARTLAHIKQITPGNPATHGYKVYSQSDEDGIINYIFSLIGKGHRTFIEIGCGNGIENNTHALLLDNWRGGWVDANNNLIKHIKKTLPDSSALSVLCETVTENNILSVITSFKRKFDVYNLDFLSIDIDSQDLNLAKVILGQIKPRVICVEYNSKFPPPFKISVGPDARVWHGDDYQGASLSSFVALFDSAGYRLVACTVSGVNAFFVNNKEAPLFPSYTPEELYQPARYYLRYIRSGHRPSMKFLRDKLSNDRVMD